MYSQSLELITRRINLLHRLDIIDISIGDTPLEVYTAYRKKDRVNGLSGVAELDVDGMLFCYPEGSYASFTMRGMLIDLDIAWYDRDGSMLDIGSFDRDFRQEIKPLQRFFYLLEAPKGTIPEGNMRIINGV